MASAIESNSQRNSVVGSPDDASAPHDIAVPLSLSQITLPSTDIPASPVGSDVSWKTELNDDRPGGMIIPSSLTPPPSTQIDVDANTRGTFAPSQESSNLSQPVTTDKPIPKRDASTEYEPPDLSQVADASAEDLRSLLQTCISEYRKVKTESAHLNLQYNFLRINAEIEQQRSVVELELVQKEVDALLAREAKKESSLPTELMRAQFMDIKTRYEGEVEATKALRNRLKLAKRVIRQKEEKQISMIEEQQALLNRIRENREHLNIMRRPGGIFHNASIPRYQMPLDPPQHRSANGTSQHSHTRSARSDNSYGREDGLSALLQAMNQSQQNNNSGAPNSIASHRAGRARYSGRHRRSTHSLSSLPATPFGRAPAEAMLLPSVNLVPHLEARHRYIQKPAVPTIEQADYGFGERKSSESPATPTIGPGGHGLGLRRSPDSTISAEDHAELARQAMQSVDEMQSLSRRRSMPMDDVDNDCSQDEDARKDMEHSGPRQVETALSRQATDGGLGMGKPLRRYSSLRGSTEQHVHRRPDMGEALESMTGPEKSQP